MSPPPSHTHARRASDPIPSSRAASDESGLHGPEPTASLAPRSRAERAAIAGTLSPPPSASERARQPGSPQAAVAPSGRPRARATAGERVAQADRHFAVGGDQGLGDVELLALAIAGDRAEARARALLDAAGGLDELLRWTSDELVRQGGASPGQARRLVCAVALVRRAALRGLDTGRSIQRPCDVAEFVAPLLGGNHQEHFFVLGLDARRRVRLARTIAIGTLSQVDVHPRELFRPLIAAGIHAAILAHNHPSGDPSPSTADIQLTRRMKEVGALVGIPVLDHVIVAAGTHVSLAALGVM